MINKDTYIIEKYNNRTKEKYNMWKKNSNSTVLLILHCIFTKIFEYHHVIMK